MPSATAVATPLSFHPIANRFPLMQGAQFERFVARMKEGGYDTKKPIILYEGQILDGRNRYRAASQLKIIPTYVEYAGEYGDPWNFCLVQNADRCHYSLQELALLAAAEHKYGGYGHGGERSKSPIGDLKTTLGETAQKHGVSKRTVERAKKVLDAEPEVKELVSEGQASITDAAKMASQPREVQREAASAVKNGRAKTLSGAVNGTANGKHKGKGEAWEGGEDEVAAESPPLDRRGTPLPKGIQGIFETPLFASCIQHLREARRALDGISKHSNFQPKTAEFITRLAEIEDVVKSNVPYAVCPTCQGKSCGECRHSGWVPEWRYEELTRTA